MQLFMFPHSVAIRSFSKDFNLLLALIFHILVGDTVVILFSSRNRLQSDSGETIILSFDWKQ